MSFNTALSGLRAANQDLSVTGNNIANASTTGFKESRTQFGDVYANSILGTGSRTPGSGVLVNSIAQQFSQGNINITNNSLDLAINGNGFFIVNNQGSPSYTRAGNFGLDNLGYIVSSNGGR
jgi:flagellar hook protein FlgE